jgi:putative ABC transport system ATP-binding protein
MIQLTGVEKNYYLGQSRIEALKGINISINKGDFISIVGPSGSGKSTLLNIVGCLDKPDKGEVVIDNENIANLSANRLADIRANKIGFIFQSFNLIPVLNIYENIELPLNNINKYAVKKEKEARIMELINHVELDSVIKHKPDELSGGQRQRVAIARALVTNPQIVLADEPTANLDSVTGKLIIELMRRINKEYKTTFIFSTHDANIMSYADKVLELHDGQIKN